MSRKQGYEVLRFIEKGDSCHMALDYVDGVTLYEWISQNQEIEKEVFIKWMKDLLYQLSLYHSQRGKAEYKNLNPFHIIITKDYKIALLANKNINQDRSLEKYFIPQTNNQCTDIYCFGKIIQYILAHVECKPELTKFEELKLQIIVRKCLSSNLKYQYRDIHKIQINFMSKYKVNWKVLVIISMFLIIFGIVGFLKNNKNEDAKVAEYKIENEKKESEKKEKENNKLDEQKDLFLETGIFYFLEMRDYRKSLECLRNADIQDSRVKFYSVLAEYMNGDKTTSDLQKLKEELNQDFLQEILKGIKESIAFVRVYSFITNGEKHVEILNILGQEYLLPQKNALSKAQLIEFEEYCAAAYEKNGEIENAIKSYELLEELKEKDENKITFYQNKHIELRIMNLEKIFSKEVENNTKKIELVKEEITKNPRILQNPKFQMFLSSHKLHVEEGKIWLDKKEKDS